MRSHLCLALAVAVVVEASILKENLRIAPALAPESDKKFFKKDFPGDKRPKVDVLHFKHPYPVVQDNEDFDKDFVKDENTDNGEWKAQTEYDRLRHKLARLKKEAAEALAKKAEEKKELEKAMQQYQADMDTSKNDIAKKRSEVIEPLEPEKPEKPGKPSKPVPKQTPSEPTKVASSTEAPKAPAQPQSAPSEPKEKAEGWSWSWPSWSWPWSTPEAPKTPKMPEAPKAPDAPKEAPQPVDTSDAAEAVEKAMKNLDVCQKELDAAKDKLKKLMAEFEKAKMKQAEAHEIVQEARRKQAEAEKVEGKLHEKYKKESDEHMAANAEYMAQLRKVEQLKADLKAAAAKVKAMRDAEDAQGGVYNTPPKKSAAIATSSSVLVVSILAVVALL